MCPYGQTDMLQLVFKFFQLRVDFFLAQGGFQMLSSYIFQDMLNSNEYTFIQGSVNFPEISKLCCTVFCEYVYLGIPIKFQEV